MTKEQLAENLGTIARSGTSEFLENIEKSESNNLIGQFGPSPPLLTFFPPANSSFHTGLGFYSSFLVADRVTVASKAADSNEQWIFESEADADGFKIVKDPRGATLGRGTEITLYLKADAADEYLDLTKLRELITKHAEYNAAPIYLYSSTSLSPSPIAPVETVDEDGEVKVEEESEDLAVEPEVAKWELINDRAPLWMRDPKQVTKEEYGVRSNLTPSLSRFLPLLTTFPPFLSRRAAILPEDLRLSRRSRRLLALQG
jgi:heat shock protein beta